MALYIFGRMISYYLILTVVGITVSDAFAPCGEPAGCYCSTPVLNEIHCTGNISKFPEFEDSVKPGVLSIVFYDSTITSVPPFEKDEWDRLKYLNFVETSMMSCDDIAELWRPGLRIFSECISKMVECQKNNCNGTGICLIMMGLVIMAGTGIIVHLFRSRKGSWTLPVPQTYRHSPVTSCAIDRSDMRRSTEL